PADVTQLAGTGSPGGGTRAGPGWSASYPRERLRIRWSGTRPLTWSPPSPVGSGHVARADGGLFDADPGYGSRKRGRKTFLRRLLRISTDRRSSDIGVSWNGIPSRQVLVLPEETGESGGRRPHREPHTPCLSKRCKPAQSVVPGSAQA